MQKIILNSQLFNRVYEDKIVLITGHTGFKGSWLTLWLLKMGARVIGYSKDIPTKPSHYELITKNHSQFSTLNSQLITIFGDIRDQEKLDKVFSEYKPDIVFHLAAQPLVRLSYENPIETYEINVIGTLRIFEACKKTNVKAIVNITSDKCYENKEWVWGYRENDPMGGHDPYSSSKGCAELLTSSYRNSYFNLDDYGKKHNTLLASCRAGNVIGGGDWAEDRLIPDIIKATSKDKKVIIRNPQAIRPWQYVLEPLNGYLMIGQKLLEGKKEFAEAWNFGPMEDGNITVEQVIKICKKYWSKIEWEVIENGELRMENEKEKTNSQLSIINSQLNKHEANILKLDCSKACFKLGWRPVWDSEMAFKKTIEWYREFYENNVIISSRQLEQFIKGRDELF